MKGNVAAATVFTLITSIALGSQAEVEVQLEVAKRVGFLKEDDHRRLNTQVVEIGRMLNGLIASIKQANTMGNQGEDAPDSRGAPSYRLRAGARLPGSGRATAYRLLPTG